MSVDRAGNSTTESNSETEQFAAAVKAGDTKRVQELLQQSSALRAQLDRELPGGDFGETALLKALKLHNTSLMQVLLDSGADINQRSHWWAGGFGVFDHDYDAVDWLLARGGKLDAYGAARWGRMNELRDIITHDPTTVNMRGGDGQRPLHVASSIEVAEYLLQHGADIDALDVDHESTPAQYLIRDHTDVARYLVERGARTDVYLLAALGDMARLEKFVDANPDCVNMTVSMESFPRTDTRASLPIYFWTLGAYKSPHTVALQFDHRDAFDLLMSRSSNDLRIAIACELEDSTLYESLGATQIDHTSRDWSHLQSRLVTAVAMDRARSVRMMLDAGWPVNSLTAKNVSALHYAAWNGDAQLVALLLNKGASTTAREAMYDGTPRAWGMHGRGNAGHRPTADYAEVLRLLPE